MDVEQETVPTSREPISPGFLVGLRTLGAALLLVGAVVRLEGAWHATHPSQPPVIAGILKYGDLNAAPPRWAPQGQVGVCWEEQRAQPNVGRWQCSGWEPLNPGDSSAQVRDPGSANCVRRRVRDDTWECEATKWADG